MSRRWLVVLAVVTALSMLVAVPASAKPPIRGDMDPLDFNLGVGDPETPCPSIAWIGTITIDGVAYGMTFIPTGSGKPFDADPSPSVHFFEEIWTIYAPGTLVAEFTAGVLTTCTLGDVVLSGHDRGITTIKSSRYHMKGEVEVAAGVFTGLEGHKVHMSGTIEWYPFGAPMSAPGSFRLK